ncbi:MAG TPA: acyl-CoA thioesterase [Polyangia bacterium]|nr:acyl-CoA thioesterase [Polyangia bacterium]
MDAQDKTKRRFASEFTPRFSDFDMQGIMSSRCYLDYLVEARIDQMARCYELPLAHYAERNQTWVFSAVALDFLSPVLFGAKIVVETEVTKIEGAAATVDFAFRHPTKDRVFARGCATYHLIDLATKRPIDVPAKDVEVFLSRQA